ncbi:MAG: sodium:solute symporter family protein [Bacteroidota bacterium]
MNFVDYLIVVSFIIATFYVGSLFYRWVGTADDFYLAGRQLTPFILAAIIAATNVNLYSFIGQAGIAYTEGIPIIWQTWSGNMALVFSGLFVIPLLRRLRIRTIPEFLGLRYSKGVRTFVAALWVLRIAFWLGVVLYTAAIAGQTISGFQSFSAWVFLFSVVVVVYTMLGGMWSVAFTDVIQFIFMLAGALVVLPLAMSLVGWWPGLEASLPEGSLTLVQQTGTYNWQFILAIFLLGIEWACVDQGLLQRAFGADSTKTVARGLVIAGIITTPFALLWIVPGLAAGVLIPGLDNPDSAIPQLLTSILPHGVLGLVVVGLLSSQLSTISGNLNGAATMFTSDIFEGFLKTSASPREVLFVARATTLVVGISMVAFAYLIPLMGGAVNAYLTIIAVMDMPLFIIAIVYGLLWKRATWQGAIIGYGAGAVAGVIGQFVLDLGFTFTTFLTAGVALIITPLASLASTNDRTEGIEAIWLARHGSEEERRSQDPYHIFPRTGWGRVAMGILAAGLLLFILGVVAGGAGAEEGSAIAVGGMCLFFAGGLLRAYTD